MDHCRCQPCRRAEAGYRSYLRRLKAMGKLPLGLRVNALTTWRCIRSLKVDGLTQREIARRLGLKSGQLQLQTETITRRNQLRVQRLYQALMAEGPSVPLGESDGR